MKWIKKNVLFEICCVILIACGVFFRFYQMRWDQDALLHPDEYGLTNTISRLSIPSSLNGYFNTRISSISPYDRYDENGNKVADGVDNRMRWGQLPILLIRLISEALGQTGYSEIRMTGRYLSALADVGSMLLLFLIGRMLFDNRRIALLAVVFSSLAVLQIQQSHFMTSDNFSVFFVMLTLFSAVKLAKSQLIERNERGDWKIAPLAWRWLAWFGVFLGMAVACKINQILVAGMLVVALFISLSCAKIRMDDELGRLISLGAAMCLFAAFVFLLSFRIFQPMSFRATTGNTTLFTWHPNQDWLDSMGVAAIESSGIGGGPPSEQWAHRTPILFPLVNLVFYGVGLPLGVLAWVSCLVALALLFRGKLTAWRSLLIPLVWAFVFFLFMGTRFVKSIRYMLPIYPSLCLVASWGVITFWKQSKGFWRVAAGLVGVLSVMGTAFWAMLFVKTVYMQSHSRISAVEWIYDQISGALRLTGSEKSVDVGVPDVCEIKPNYPFETGIFVDEVITVDQLMFTHLTPIVSDGMDAPIRLRIALENDVQSSVEIEIKPDSDEQPLSVAFPPFVLSPARRTLLTVSVLEGAGVSIRRSVIANENWDEGLPFPFRGKDPFGQLYKGITNEVRWYDSAEKKQIMLDTMAQADYLMVQSQRSVWSAVRIPMTYPMTIRYYEALFQGELGFELAASFQRPFRIGSLYFSDLTGSFSWNHEPVLPIMNLSKWAAEEAFSVYDHPPVWIFKKTAAFDLAKVKQILDEVDLSQVIVQGPRDAVWQKGYGK